MRDEEIGGFIKSLGKHGYMMEEEVGNFIKNLKYRNHAESARSTITFASVDDFLSADKFELEQAKDFFYVEGAKYKVTWYLHIPCQEEGNLQARFLAFMEDYFRAAHILEGERINKRREVRFFEQGGFNGNAAVTENKIKTVVISRQGKERVLNTMFAERVGFPHSYNDSIEDLLTHRLHDGAITSRARRFTVYMQNNYQPTRLNDFHVLQFEPNRPGWVQDACHQPLLHRYLPLV